MGAEIVTAPPAPVDDVVLKRPLPEPEMITVLPLVVTVKAPPLPPALAVLLMPRVYSR